MNRKTQFTVLWTLLPELLIYLLLSLLHIDTHELFLGISYLSLSTRPLPSQKYLIPLMIIETEKRLQRASGGHLDQCSVPRHGYLQY